MKMEYVDSNMTGGYTHKKFNCGYTHKKFGLRLIQRDQQNLNSQLSIVNETSTQKTTLSEIIITNNRKSKDIFRPYALDDMNTPRKRKVTSQPSSSTAAFQPIPAAVHTSFASNTRNIYTNPYHQQQSVAVPHSVSQPLAFNKQTFTLMLQKQQAALHMRNLIINSNCNYWPTNFNQMPLLMGGMC